MRALPKWQVVLWWYQPMVVPGGDAREAGPSIRIVCKIVLTEDERGQLVVWEWIVKGKCEFRIL